LKKKYCPKTKISQQDKKAGKLLSGFSIAIPEDENHWCKRSGLKMCLLVIIEL
jgi:hypothetical protein